MQTIDIRNESGTPIESIIFGDGDEQGSRASSLDVRGYACNYNLSLCDADGDGTNKIDYRDIPNLIKALQAAHDLREGEYYVK